MISVAALVTLHLGCERVPLCSLRPMPDCFMPPNGASAFGDKTLIHGGHPSLDGPETRKTHFTCFAMTVAGEAKRPRASQEVPPPASAAHAR